MADTRRELKRKIALMTGDYNASIFLCFLVYWTTQAIDADGWIAVTQSKILEHTGLEGLEQKIARDYLRKHNWIEENRIEYEEYSRLEYKVNIEKFKRLFAA